jgi:hypothetical protein
MVRRWLQEHYTLAGTPGRRAVREGTYGGGSADPGGLTHHDHLYRAHKAALEAGDHELADKILALLRHRDDDEDLLDEEDEDLNEEEPREEPRLRRVTGQESRTRRPARGRGLLEGRTLADMSDIQIMRWLRQPGWPW